MTIAPAQPPGSQGEQLGSLLRTLGNRWILLASSLVAGVIVGLLVSLLSATQYTASAYAVVVPEGGGSDSSAVTAASSVAQGYARIATNPALVAPSLARGRLPVAPADVQRIVRVSASPDAPVIEVYATRHSPGQAARLADAVVDGLVNNNRALRPGIGFRVQRFVGATVPTRPSNPSRLFYLGLGGLVGLLIGGLIAFTAGARPGRADASAGWSDGRLSLGDDGSPPWSPAPGPTVAGPPPVPVVPRGFAHALPDEAAGEPTPAPPTPARAVEPPAELGRYSRSGTRTATPRAGELDSSIEASLGRLRAAGGGSPSHSASGGASEPSGGADAARPARPRAPAASASGRRGESTARRAGAAGSSGRAEGPANGGSTTEGAAPARNASRAGRAPRPSRQAPDTANGGGDGQGDGSRGDGERRPDGSGDS